MKLKYYRVAVESELGGKLQELQAKMDEICKSRKELCEKYGTEKCFTPDSPFIFFGGMIGFGFSENPDAKVWKEPWSKCFTPKQNSKIGKSIKVELEAIPVISTKDLEKIFNPKKHDENSRYAFDIGLVKNKNGYFKVCYESDIWSLKCLETHEEITCSEYDSER